MRRGRALLRTLRRMRAAWTPAGEAHRLGRRVLAAWLVLVVVAGSAPPRVGADGDPASDVLLVQSVFYPYQPRVGTGLQNTMNAALRAAEHAGLALKVAIIGTREELGLVPYLFGHPQAYATFLDREISFNRPQPLLVVMPAGFGVANAGSPAPLGAVPLDARQRSYGLTRSAILGVIALAREREPRLAAPAIPADAPGGGQAPALLVFGLPVALIATTGLLAMYRTRSRRHGGRAQG